MPLFLSHIRIERECRRTLPRAIGPWSCDSSAYSQLALHGRWKFGVRRYVEDVRRYRDQVGNLQWASIRDWMCEAHVLAKTGLSVLEHQTRTVASYDELLDLAPEIWWVPVLQGFTRDEYMRCADMYQSAGHELKDLPMVGLGSVCRRQDTDLAEDIIRELTAAGIKVHGFGFKTLGLGRVKDVVASADSMAWSLNAKNHPPLPGCTHKHCNNCLKYALRWREKMFRTINYVEDML